MRAAPRPAPAWMQRAALTAKLAHLRSEICAAAAAERDAVQLGNKLAGSEAELSAVRAELAVAVARADGLERSPTSSGWPPGLSRRRCARGLSASSR